jgi:DNA repair protein RadC
LELILFRTVRRADTKPVTNPLLNKCKFLPEVFGAPEQFLTGLEDVGESTGFNLKG